ncbi:Cytochrome c-type biogenesis protein CcmH precursor [Roseovarius albus]|uniref:Cytochrome c-type biogenesis protein n=2 Tax=Roseovarius albus TaxID=1247867 RepID=A0A1X6ZDH7_9RHOB|nr:cytochrome c-type biogenesis protein [Roseovarius albus]SLN48007.1 Cytochrome c-type biogenesis protein CcmH precursor [Roseovarius albus]
MIRTLFKLLVVASVVTVMQFSPAAAVEPDEVLSDPVLEKRARSISEGLRCLVCRNESIDESNAPLARDLRILVRERLVEGDADDEVIEFVVARYGEYVLLKPNSGGSNLVLWLSGPAMLLIAGGVGLAFLRRRSRSVDASSQGLSADEQARLEEILKE